MVTSVRNYTKSGTEVQPQKESEAEKVSIGDVTPVHEANEQNGLKDIRGQNIETRGAVKESRGRQ